MILRLRHELSKLYRRFTPYVVYGAVVGLVALVILSLHYSPPPWLTDPTRRGKLADMQVMGSPLNGTLACELILKSIARLLPFLAPVVCGEILGAEGATGTLRTLLVRPGSRSVLWFAKFVCAALFTLSLSAVTMLSSLLLGWLVLGQGKLFEVEALHDGRVVILTQSEAVWYLAVAYLVLAVAVFAASMLGFMLGSFFDNALAPGFAALGLTMVLWIVGSLGFDWLDRIQPYLYTSQFSRAMDTIPTNFNPDTQELIPPWHTIASTLRICGAYIAVFAAVGWYRFVKRDVTC